MNSLEIIALIFAIIILLETFLWLFFDVKMRQLVKKLLAPNHMTAFMIAYTIGAVVVGYFLLQSLTFVELGAAMLFTSLLLGTSMLPYYQAIVPAILDTDIFSRDAFLKTAWVFSIWVIIALFILRTLFF